MKYVKRRIPVEAEQFWPDKIPWPEGVMLQNPGYPKGPYTNSKEIV